MYTVLVDKKVEIFIKKQPANQAKRLRDAISSLAKNPRSHGCKKLEGYDDEYRLRIGQMRILYTINDAIVTVIVLKAGYRGDVYK